MENKKLKVIEKEKNPNYDSSDFYNQFFYNSMSLEVPSNLHLDEIIQEITPMIPDELSIQNKNYPIIKQVISNDNFGAVLLNDYNNFQRIGYGSISINWDYVFGISKNENIIKVYTLLKNTCKNGSIDDSIYYGTSLDSISNEGKLTLTISNRNDFQPENEHCGMYGYNTFRRGKGFKDMERKISLK